MSMLWKRNVWQHCKSRAEKIKENQILLLLQEYSKCHWDINALFRVTLNSPQIDDVLAKLITAMTREGKFKDAIQDRIGATVDTLIWKSSYLY